MVTIPKITTREVIAGAGGLIVGGGLGYLAGSRIGSKKSKRRKKSKSRSVRKRSTGNKSRRKLKFGSKAYRKKYLGHRRRTPHTAGKGKDTSHRRIRYTKKGQPYVILASGKARFIKMSSAKQSHKREGGRY